MGRRYVITTSGAKQTKVFGNKEPLKTDNTENIRDNTKAEHSENSKKKVFGTEEPGNTENTKEEDSENSKGKLKYISNTDQETKQTNVLDNKEPIKTDKTENISDNTTA